MAMRHPYRASRQRARWAAGWRSSPATRASGDASSAGEDRPQPLQRCSRCGGRGTRAAG